MPCVRPRRSTSVLGFIRLQWVEFRCCEDVLSLGLKPTGSPDYLVRGFGAMAQLHAVLE